MLFPLVNRKSICFVLVLLTLGLVSLGVRLPWSSGWSSSPAKPKPRPRAIVQNQINSCKQVINDYNPFAAILPPAHFIALPAPLVPSVALELPSFLSAAQLPRSSRAPPAPA